MSETEHDSLQNGARRLLDASVAGLDAATRSRLNQARQRALAGHTRRRPILGSGWGGGWALGGVAASVCVMVIAYALWQGQPAGQPYDALADLEVLTADDQIDLYEDLDFYEWLDSDAQTG